MGTEEGPPSDPERTVRCASPASRPCSRPSGWRLGVRPLGLAEQQALSRDICAYLPLVERMVRQLARRLPANVQRDDLLAAGVCGLVDSLRRNGGDGGAAFSW